MEHQWSCSWDSVVGEVKPRLGVHCTKVGVGNGNYGGRREYDLPPNGALHIMIHEMEVEAAFNLSQVRREMKETAQATLLPYYNNDEDLYNKRVTIIDNSGERTLRFFTEVTKKDNVLAVAFQDEPAPDYHLPTFNKTPQNLYSSDLPNLKWIKWISRSLSWNNASS